MSMHSRGLDMMIRISGEQGVSTGIIESPDSSVDGWGQPIPSWTTFGAVDVYSLKPNEMTSKSLETEQALRLVTAVTVIVVCTYLPGVTQGMRITIGGRELYIGYVNDMAGLNKAMNLYCGETLA